jgi:aconitate hydratase
MPSLDSFKSRKTLTVGAKTYVYYSLEAAAQNGLGDISRLPVSLKVLLENLLRFEDGKTVTQADIQAFAGWLKDKGKAEVEIAYRPARVLMQDFTGVPAVVDLAAMRDAAAKLGANPKAINPLVPVDLVIDHSVMVDYLRQGRSFEQERRARIRAQHGALRVPEMGPDRVRQFPRRAARHRHLPPGEPRIPRPDRLDEGRRRRDRRLPDTCVGTDSHTTMINGLAVLGWGVGGIEAEAAMLGQPSPC